MTVVRNAATNVVERIVTAVLTLVTVPVQVRLLSLEAYGLLGFVASLQLLFGILDFGLGPTIIREVAADQGGAGGQSRPLVRTFSTVYWALAACAGVALVGAAPWVADHWLHATSLPRPTVILAVRLTAILVLLRWPVSLYAGAIAGAQRLDVVNGIRIAMSTLKLLGGLLILLAFRTVSSYLFWLAGAAIVEVGCYMAVAVRVVPQFTLKPGFSWPSLQRVWRFSLHMNVISVMAAIFLQADRLMLSRLRPIADLGIYSMAYNLAVGISVLQTVVSTALFPAFAQEAGRTGTEARQWCAVATQLVMFLACGAAAAIVIYGNALLTVWISAAAAVNASRTAAILAVGFAASAAVSVPYTLAIASGETTVAFAVNLTAGALYIPALYALIELDGLNGAAWGWVGLNVYYLVVLLPILRRRVGLESVRRWFFRNVLPFAVLAFGIVGISHELLRMLGLVRPIPALIALPLAGLVYAVVAYRLLDPSVGTYLRRWPERLGWRQGASAA